MKITLWALFLGCHGFEWLDKFISFIIHGLSRVIDIYIYIYMVRNPKTVHRYFDLSQLLRKKKQKTRSKGTSIKSQERFGVVNFFD